MSKYQIAVVVSSLRRGSFNRNLASAIVKLALPEFSFTQAKIDDLPLYNQDDDGNQAESVKRLKNVIKSAHGRTVFRPSVKAIQPMASSR